MYHVSTSTTYDHRLKRIGHPVRSAIHKLVVQWIDALNRANRHSVESEPRKLSPRPQVATAGVLGGGPEYGDHTRIVQCLRWPELLHFGATEQKASNSKYGI
jgi:hypothetical protein